MFSFTVVHHPHPIEYNFPTINWLIFILFPFLPLITINPRCLLDLFCSVHCSEQEEPRKKSSERVPSPPETGNIFCQRQPGAPLGKFYFSVSEVYSPEGLDFFLFLSVCPLGNFQSSSSPFVSQDGLSPLEGSNPF